MMDCGGYHYQFVNSLLEGSDLLCKICRLPSRNPHLSSCCGHTFCKGCIDNLREVKNVTHTCPVCRDADFPVVQNKQIDRAVRALHVYCTNEKEGCQWQGEVSGIAGHLNSDCLYESVECENSDCEKHVQRQFLGRHMKIDCPYHDVDCQYCHIKDKRWFIESKHKVECPKYPLPCPNGCEVGTIFRQDLNQHRELCPLEMIMCEYYGMGCEVKIPRSCIEDHNRKNADKHLQMLKYELTNTKKDLQQAQKVAMNAIKKVNELQLKFQEKINYLETREQENIINLEAQLYNSICQFHKNCSPWTLKLNTLAAMSSTGEQVVPVILKLANFSKMKREWPWNSVHFYSHNKESKMYLSVYTDENADRKNNYLSVCLSLVHADSEVALKGNIKLLNQIDDQEHHCVSLDCFDAAAAKSEWMIFSEWKNPTFISHNSLNAMCNTCNFIKNDSLFFEVYVRLHVTVKLPHKEHCSADSLPSPLATNVRITVANCITVKISVVELITLWGTNHNMMVISSLHSEPNVPT